MIISDIKFSKDLQAGFLFSVFVSMMVTLVFFTSNRKSMKNTIPVQMHKTPNSIIVVELCDLSCSWIESDPNIIKRTPPIKLTKSS